MMKSAKLLVLVLILIFANCTRKHAAPVLSPEQVVKEFVTLSATSKDGADKKRLQELCIGDLRRTFERMTEEAFRVIYLDSKLKVQDLSILSTKVEGDTATVRYKVAVENSQGTDATHEVNTRVVVLTRSEGYWVIKDVRMDGLDQIAFTRGMIF